MLGTASPLAPAVNLSGISNESKESIERNKQHNARHAHKWRAIVSYAAMTRAQQASLKSQNARLARIMSAVMGAQSAPSFWAAVPPLEIARAADYCINVIWPNLLMDRAAAMAWFSAFREQPIIFHAFHYAMAVHHDLLCNNASWTITKNCLRHKIRAIKLLNKILSSLNDDNIEWAILAAVVLASNEPENTLTKSVSWFDPHLPSANWMSVYARMEQVPEHGRAMIRLIQKRGGLNEIKFPGLGAILAFSDLLTASYGTCKPYFECTWPDELANLHNLQPRIYSPMSLYSYKGHGFQDKVPGGLPRGAILIFQKMALVDHAMDQCRNLHLRGAEMKNIVAVRNRAQYELLSLPSWEELESIDRAIYDSASYDCCWLTTLLYSGLVIFPLSPQHEWLARTLKQITALLTLTALKKWGQYPSPFLLWVLVICCIASFHTREHVFFSSTLQRILVKHDLLSKAAVQSAVKEFLWTDSACGQSFNEFWLTLDLDINSPSCE